MKNIKWKVALLAVVLIVAMLAVPIAAAPGLSAERGHYLVGFHGPPSRALVEQFDGEVYREFTIIDAIAVRLTDQAAEALQKNPMVRYVGPDIEVYALEQTVPWGINRVFGDEEYSFGTWTSAPGKGIGVAVLDTGIDQTHEDLSERGGVRFYMESTGPPWNRRLLEDENYQDGHGHGTHVAGTIAALDNDFGVVGVAPSVDLYAVKVLDDGGSGTLSQIVAGIEWVVDENKENGKNIKIINMSLGAGSHEQAFQDACDAAYNADILLVSSAGNSGEGPDTLSYPAKYESVIAVAASDKDDNRASFSSTGPDVELIAPGVDVYSAWKNNSYYTANGTSMASPHVAGAAALVWAADPDQNNTAVRAILSETAEDLRLPTNHQGEGMVRADLAVAAVTGSEPPPPLQPETYDLTISSTDGGSVTEPGEGTYTHEEGTVVDLLAVADSGYRFMNWTGETDTIADVNAASTTITINDKYSIKANFEESASEGVVRVESITYTTRGGRLNDRHLDITLLLLDNQDNLVPGASVSATLERNGTFWNFQGTTGSNGTVVFTVNNHGSGNYSTKVTAVEAEGLKWDGDTPENSYSK